MSNNKIELFVMHNCQICPQMERLFKDMHQKGAIDALEIIDIGEHPDIAQKHNIRSVPHYLINDVAFYGLKTQQEILTLLQQKDIDKWQEFIKSELAEGQLDTVEQAIREEISARDAMMLLLIDSETSLVVRIGLSAIIESIAGTGILNQYENQFIDLTQHNDESIAIDAIYYLSLLATQSCVATLIEIAQNGLENLKLHAAEALEELSSEQLKH